MKRSLIELYLKWTIQLELSKDLILHEIELVTFTSSSTVESFMELDPVMPDHLIMASIGPVTSETIRPYGYEVDIESEESNIPSLVDAIEEYYLTLRDKN